MKRGQVSTEFMIILSVILVILIFISVVMFDVNVIARNFGDISSGRYWSTADVGVLGMDLNGTVGNVSVINNLDYSVEVVGLTFDSVDVLITPLSLDSGESGIVMIDYDMGGEKYFEVNVGFDLVDSTGKEFGFVGARKYSGVVE